MKQIKQMKKGDTYCTMWTTHLAGPFVYDGKANLLFAVLIIADKITLDFAKEAFDVLFGEISAELENDDSFEMQDVIDIERIENSTSLSPIEAQCIKKVRPQILNAIGGAV